MRNNMELALGYGKSALGLFIKAWNFTTPSGFNDDFWESEASSYRWNGIKHGYCKTQSHHLNANEREEIFRFYSNKTDDEAIKKMFRLQYVNSAWYDLDLAISITLKAALLYGLYRGGKIVADCSYKAFYCISSACSSAISYGKGVFESISDKLFNRKAQQFINQEPARERYVCAGYG